VTQLAHEYALLAELQERLFSCLLTIESLDGDRGSTPSGLEHLTERARSNLLAETDFVERNDPTLNVSRLEQRIDLSQQANGLTSEAGFGCMLARLVR